MAAARLILDGYEPSQRSKIPLWKNVVKIGARRDYRDLQRFNDAYLLLMAVMTKCEQEFGLVAIGDAEAHARFPLLIEDMQKAQHEMLQAFKCMSFIAMINHRSAPAEE
jgi:hypothetical protein